MAIKPEFRHSFGKLTPEERRKLSQEAAKKRWALEAKGAPDRGQDFSRPGPVLIPPPPKTRNLTKFFTQIELAALRRVHSECIYFMDTRNPVPHKFRRRDAWYRAETLECAKRIDRMYWRKLINWGAYIRPGRFKLRLVEPTPEWPFTLRVVPWLGWWKWLK